MRRKRILLVDDSLTMLMVERFILEKEGYDLVTAMDGHEAIRSAIEHRPDLILLDVIMPRMGGFETCRFLRGMESTKNTPIIMVTTRGEAPNVAKGWSNGCTDYVTKPINTIELLSKVRHFIEVMTEV